MRIAICEDNHDHASILIKYIEQWANEKGIATSISYYPDPEAFLLDWYGKNVFDLAFLDIEMPKMNGLELARRIRQTDKAMLIIFTTGHKSSAFRAFDVRAFHFLVKPLRENECLKVLTDAHHTIRSRMDDTFLIIRETGSERLYKYDILYFEMDNHYVIVHTLKGDIRYKEKLSNIIKVFEEPHFCLCHRSYLLNLQHVDVINLSKVRIDNGKILPVSRGRWEPLNKCFISYYTRVRRDAAEAVLY